MSVFRFSFFIGKDNEAQSNLRRRTRKRRFKTFVTVSVTSWIVVVAALEDTIHQITRINTKRLNVFLASLRLDDLRLSVCCFQRALWWRSR